MSEDVQRDAPARSQDHGGARRKADYIALTKAARARFDTLAAESIEAVFQAVLTAATQDGDMAAAKLLIDRVIPSRRGAPVSFHIRPLKTPEDCALAYADLLDDVGAGRLTPEEAQTISAIVAKRAELFPSIELAAEIEALKAQLAAVVGVHRPPTPRAKSRGSASPRPGALLRSGAPRGDHRRVAMLMRSPRAREPAPAARFHSAFPAFTRAPARRSARPLGAE